MPAFVSYSKRHIKIVFLNFEAVLRLLAVRSSGSGNVNRLYGTLRTLVTVKVVKFTYVGYVTAW